MSSYARKQRRRTEREQCRDLGRDLTVPFVEDFDEFLATLHAELVRTRDPSPSAGVVDRDRPG